MLAKFSGIKFNFHKVSLFGVMDSQGEWVLIRMISISVFKKNNYVKGNNGLQIVFFAERTGKGLWRILSVWKKYYGERIPYWNFNFNF